MDESAVPKSQYTFHLGSKDGPFDLSVDVMAHSAFEAIETLFHAIRQMGTDPFVAVGGVHHHDVSEFRLRVYPQNIDRSSIEYIAPVDAPQAASPYVIAFDDGALFGPYPTYSLALSSLREFAIDQEATMPGPLVANRSFKPLRHGNEQDIAGWYAGAFPGHTVEIRQVYSRLPVSGETK